MPWHLIHICIFVPITQFCNYFLNIFLFSHIMTLHRSQIVFNFMFQILVNGMTYDRVSINIRINEWIKKIYYGSLQSWLPDNTAECSWLVAQNAKTKGTS